MKRWIFSIVLVCYLLCCHVSSIAEVSSARREFLHHDLKVILYPEENRFTAEDTITVPGEHATAFRFMLHRGLHPSSQTGGVSIVKESEATQSGLAETYRMKLPQGVKTFVIRYGGIINHPIEQFGKEQARSYSQTAGMISNEGIYLSGSSYWYPAIYENFITFNLYIELPPAWDAISQGERTSHLKDHDKTQVQWSSAEPQEEIYLVAGKFIEFSKASGSIQAMVFLRLPDNGLANKYLDATLRYVKMYEELIGPYPYKKFALIENFWETGFGMPSFTLLGPRVIRFPFIINSSYPHEILHNWWGNSVFPDYSKGNWSEGLTAYLSDHLFKEQQGEGADYRQVTLQKYADYVLAARDFPLTEFVSRHSSSSEAIGYGKSLMFFHTLRLELGDSMFVRCLRDFYQKNRFAYATFTDLQKSFERVSGKSLQTLFDQWIARPGAPKLQVRNLKVHKENSGYILTAMIEQMQQEKEYQLNIPVAVTLEGQAKAYRTAVFTDKREMNIKLALPLRPLRIDIDPEFDLFRRPDRNEMPPAVTQALGAKRMLVILPSSAEAKLLQAYRAFAQTLSRSGPDEVAIKLDSEVQQIPADSAVTVIGWGNRFLRKVTDALSAYDITVSMQNVRLEKTQFPKEDHTVVLTAWNPEKRDFSLMFIATEIPEALPGLGRKLPHYHRYSFLAFKGSEPENIAKGRWPVLDSPMTVFIPDEEGVIIRVSMGDLHQRAPLLPRQLDFSAERMMDTIMFLAGEELKGRGLGTSELERAAEFIAQRFQEAGLKPAGDGDTYFQTWEDTDPRNPAQKITLRNVIGAIPGKKQEWTAQSVVVGAHYDHLGTIRAQDQHNNPLIHYGADDNASGVAVLTELARVFSKSMNPDRSIVFIAFSGEESGQKGSKFYTANQKHYPANKCIGMLNLDTVGRFGTNKLLILGAGSAKEWVYIFRGAGSVAGVEVETVSEELDSSDQKSFWDSGIPAVQLFTGPHTDYHKTTDIPEKIDAQGLVKVAFVAKEVIEHLAGREQLLSATLKPKVITESDTKERKVSLGSIPDFAYSGEGYRISGIVQRSPAEKAGLREGDVITKINTSAIKKLKDLSDILKSSNPGEKVTIIFLREGKELKTEAVLVEK